jgi:predicted transcriptional regulator YdeE
MGGHSRMPALSHFEAQKVDQMSIEPRIVEYGPYRLIGMSCVGSESAQFKELWAGENGFLSRMAEIESLGDGTAYGLCRCVAGVTDGSFEYVAAVPAKSDAPVPNGMIEARVGAATYAAFDVLGLDNIGPAWGATQVWLAEHPEWESYCHGGGDACCGCADYPCFELYPSDFDSTGVLFIYIPIRRKA